MSQPPEQPYYPQQPGYPSQQPGYPPPQPGYPPQQQHGHPQQPGYQQPYPQPEQWGPPAPPPVKKSRAGRIVLIVLAALLVLCGGSAAVAYFALKDDVEGVVDAAKTRVEAPETLAGRKKITDPELVRVADGMVADMRKDISNETGAVGAFYGDPAKQDLIMVAAASGLVRNPETQLDDAFREMGSSDLKMSTPTEVDAGPLGGHAKCADGTAEEVPVAMCVWADNGSLGVIAFYFKQVDQIKADFVTVRGEVEKRE
ncbi:MAG TPA: hypothetical protein VFB84_07030 [Micromonosporaceae bacterium]|nr:hypothetical protein [Micromonosporaceae bacterium]